MMIMMIMSITMMIIKIIMIAIIKLKIMKSFPISSFSPQMTSTRKEEEWDEIHAENAELRGGSIVRHNGENGTGKNEEEFEENNEQPEQIILESLESGYEVPGSSSYRAGYQEEGQGEEGQEEEGQEEGGDEGAEEENLYFEAAQETARSDVEGTESGVQQIVRDMTVSGS